MFFSSSAMSEIGSGHQNSHFVESFKCAGGMPNILEWMGRDHQRVARKWTAYLHDANRFFGVDSSATFNNKLLITLHASWKRFIIHIRCCQIFGWIRKFYLILQSLQIHDIKTEQSVSVKVQLLILISPEISFSLTL